MLNNCLHQLLGFGSTKVKRLYRQPLSKWSSCCLIHLLSQTLCTVWTGHFPPTSKMLHRQLSQMFSWITGFLFFMLQFGFPSLIFLDICTHTKKTHNQLGGTGIQWCLHILVEMDSSKRRAMNLNHWPPLLLSHHTHPRSQAAHLSSGFCLYVSNVMLAWCFLHSPLCLTPIYLAISTLTNWPNHGHLQGGEKVIYSSFQDTASASFCCYSAPTLLWSSHQCEPGVWVVISSTCKHVVRSWM